MEVTRKNFCAVLPQVCAAIDGATFVCVDTEFTGLPCGRAERGELLDSMADRYAALSASVKRYAILQFGLSAFTVHHQTGRVQCETFNFFLCPRQSGSSGDIDCQSFLCLPSSLEFLVANGFDFNKTFADGIGHLRADDEQKLRRRLAGRSSGGDPNWAEPGPGAKSAGNSGAAPLPADGPARDLFNRNIELIRGLLTSSDETGNGADGGGVADDDGGDSGGGGGGAELDEDRCVDLPNLSSYQRKLLYDHVTTLVSDRVQLATVKRPGDVRVLRATLAPPGGRAAGSGAARQQRRLERDLAEAAGFSRVISAISSSGKPVVGHNLLYDILLIVHHYYCPLPSDYHEFKQTVNSLFPCLLDTKLMGLMPPFRHLLSSTMLAEMVDALSTAPFTMPDIECVGASSYSLKESKCHEAGYDTFLTGAALSAMLRYLGEKQSPSVKFITMNNDMVKVFNNKIHTPSAHEVLYIDLDGSDPEPRRDHVFHVTFPTIWRTSDIYKLFNPVGMINVKWIDDSSAFVTLSQPDKAASVTTQIECPVTVKITPYATYKVNQKLSQRSGKKIDKSGGRSPIGLLVHDVTVATNQMDVSKRQSSPVDQSAVDTDSAGRKKARNSSKSPPPSVQSSLSAGGVEEDEGVPVGDAPVSSDLVKRSALFEVPKQW